MLECQWHTGSYWKAGPGAIVPRAAQWVTPIALSEALLAQAVTAAAIVRFAKVSRNQQLVAERGVFLRSHRADPCSDIEHAVDLGLDGLCPDIASLVQDDDRALPTPLRINQTVSEVRSWISPLRSQRRSEAMRA